MAKQTTIRTPILRWLILPLCLVCALVIVAALDAGAPRTLDRIVAQEPHFAGAVEAVYENSLLVRVAEGDAVRNSSDLVSVPLAGANKDGLSVYSVGDEVVVYYDGAIAESYPAQISTVYAVTLAERAKQTYALEDAAESQNIGKTTEITLYADGTAALKIPPISSYVPPGPHIRTGRRRAYDNRGGRQPRGRGSLRNKKRRPHSGVRHNGRRPNPDPKTRRASPIHR